MAAFSIQPSTEKQQSVVQVRVVRLDGNIMNPWLYAIVEPGKYVSGKKTGTGTVHQPFRIYRRLEDQGIRGNKPFKPTRPCISINLLK
jgi:hypothetical protein